MLFKLQDSFDYESLYMDYDIYYRMDILSDYYCFTFSHIIIIELVKNLFD